MNRHIARDAQDSIENLGDLNGRFSGKTVLLTGAGGFLGAQFCHYFAALNDSGALSVPCRLMAYDNFIRGVPEWLSALRGRSDFLLEQADVTKFADYPKADFVIHGASIASPIFYRRYPIETMDANVVGLRNLLEGCRINRPESFLFFSTSEIYGDPDPAHIPTAEDYRGYVSCTGPRACYDESKRYGETLCVAFTQVHGLPIKTARPFNNYGPGLKLSDRRVLPDFFRDALSGSDITLLSDGSATRTFCYVSDAITGYVLVLLSEHDGEAFNIGTEVPEISMLELARLVVTVTGKPVDVRFRKSEDTQYLRDNPQRRCPDISKARAMLGYSPKISLEEGLERTLEYYLDHRDPTEA